MKTRLSPIDEVMFQKWYANQPTVKAGLVNPNPDDPEHLYDLRGSYLAGNNQDASGHLSSQFKQIGHPRYFLNGEDTTTGQPTNLENILNQIFGGK